jgi:hypothetical protein
MDKLSFEVQVSDYSSSLEEWRRAMQAPGSVLPKLSDAQKEVARKFKISEAEYARGVLAGLYGNKRMRQRAQRLGERVQAVLEEEGRGDRVIAVRYQMDRLRWILTLRTAEREVNVAVPGEVADDVLDWGLGDQVQDLRRRVLGALGGGTLAVPGRS